VKPIEFRALPSQRPSEQAMPVALWPPAPLELVMIAVPLPAQPEPTPAVALV
jgi:hypothetical protein